MGTRESLKIMAFITVMTLLVVFADHIQDWVISRYNQYVDALASRTLASNTIKGY